MVSLELRNTFCLQQPPDGKAKRKVEGWKTLEGRIGRGHGQMH